MNVGLIGTGAIAAKHAQAWLNIGCKITACTNRTESKGRAFADQWGARFLPTPQALCLDDRVDVVDVCTFPDYRIEPVKLCASLHKPIQLQKPIARTLSEAEEIVTITRDRNLTLGVVSQHRFDASFQFLYHAIAVGRLGRILQADCYVKWHRSAAYYAPMGKGAWSVEGGGALINQAIHQVDLLRWLIGPVAEVCARWRLAATHHIESEDIVNALLEFESGAAGVLQASTSFAPGYPERIEIHGTKGTAVVEGDKLVRWDVIDDDAGEPAPVAHQSVSGASDPMAISLLPFERQFQDLLDAHRDKRQPLITAEDGRNALAIVDAVYRSCRTKECTSIS